MYCIYLLTYRLHIVDRRRRDESPSKVGPQLDSTNSTWKPPCQSVTKSLKKSKTPSYGTLKGNCLVELLRGASPVFLPARFSIIILCRGILSLRDGRDELN